MTPRRRHLTPSQLADRRAAFDAIAARRRLTAAEQAERANLDWRFYMREWRRNIAERARARHA